MRKHHNNAAFSLLLVVGDVLAILGAYSLAYIVRVKVDDAPVADFIPAQAYFMSLLTLVPFIILVFSLIGTYKNIDHQKKFSQIIRVLLGALVAMLCLITLDYFYEDPLFPAKLVPLYGLLFSIGLLGLVRVGLFTARWIWRRKEDNLRTVVIVGDTPTAASIAKSVKRRNSGYKLIGVVGDRRLKFTTHKDLKGAVRRKSPDIIIQVATNQQPLVNPELLEYAVKHFTEFKFIPSDADKLSSQAKLELFMGDVPVLDITQTALSGWGRIAKRVLDFTVSLIALIVASPIILIIAIINYFAFGKVFFKHGRLTFGDRTFQLYKFQTVSRHLNGLTPEEAFTKIGRPELIKKYRDGGDFLEDDPRYGAWAKFLRKTSLDELPQLWNVLKGDISLVGPRALIPQELETFEQRYLILSVKSGITGLAQISGRRDLPWDQRRKLDIYYVQNWSFGLDLQILVNTAWQVIMRRGAQ